MIAFFWANIEGDLKTFSREVLNQKEAKNIANSEGWRLIGVQKNTKEFQQTLLVDKQKASLQILHFEAVKAGRKKWYEDIPV